MYKDYLKYSLIIFIFLSSKAMAVNYIETFDVDNRDVYPEFETGMSLTQNIKDIIINLAQTKSGATSQFIHKASDLEAQYFIVENQYKDKRTCFKVNIDQRELFNNNKADLAQIKSLELIGQASIKPSNISALHLLTETSRTYVYRTKSKNLKENLLVKIYIPKNGQVIIKHYKADIQKEDQDSHRLPEIAGAQEGKTLEQAFKKMYDDKKTVHVINYDMKDTAIEVGAVEFSDLNNKKIEVAALKHENVNAAFGYDESLNLNYNIDAQKQMKIKSTKVEARAAYDHQGNLDYSLKASDDLSIGDQKIDGSVEVTPEVVEARIAHKYYTSNTVYSVEDQTIDIEQELALPTNTTLKHSVSGINSGSKQSYEIEQKVWISNIVELKANQQIKEIIGSMDTIEYKTKLDLKLKDTSFDMSGDYSTSRGFGIEQKSYGLSARKTFKSTGVIVGIRFAKNEYNNIPDELEAMATISIPLN